MDPQHLLLPGRPPGDQSIYNEVFRQSVYEKYYTLTPTDIVLDIGAHAGFFTWKAAQTVQQVYAFEPSPDNFEALEKNTGHLANVRRYKFAAGSYEHTTDLWWAPHNSGGHSLYKNLVNQHTVSYRVRVKRLDQYLPPGRVTFMKIDAEGAEAEIIKGAYEKLSCFRPAIAIEIHSAPIHKEVEGLLSPLGYELHAKGGGYCSMLYAVPK